jgi:hypothetical protein
MLSVLLIPLTLSLSLAKTESKNFTPEQLADVEQIKKAST